MKAVGSGTLYLVMLCKVLENIEVAPKIFRLTAENEKIARESVPGQFLHIRISEYFPLLRRPMSVHDVREKYFSILYKIRGEGTRILSDYSPGEKIDVIGPLGRGFFVKDTNHISIIAGGMGIAPLFFLARIKRPVTIFIGAKTRDEIPLLDKLSGLGGVNIATEDGSLGEKGMVTDFLDKVDKESLIAACGPMPMLKIIKSFAEKHKIPCQLSLEERMACGLGFCLSCAVKAKNGYRYVCKDGPVFWSEEIW